MNKLINILHIFKKDKECEITMECNPDDLDKEKLLLLKKGGINRISIGIQSTCDKYLKYLNRTQRLSPTFIQ